MKLDAASLTARLRERARLEVALDGFRDSAVLVPIIVEPGAPDRLLFTVRRAELTNHAGQISFPGGKRDPDDLDAQATAIREAAEELAIEPAAVEVLGMLDDVPTPTRFVITPVVARVRGPLELRPAAGEVAQVFAAPIGELSYADGGVRTFLGISYAMHEYRWQSHLIWGATARMVHQLLALMSLPR